MQPQPIPMPMPSMRKTFDQIFNERMTALIKEVEFPMDKVPDGFRDYLTLALPVLTHHKLQCSLDEFISVCHYAANCCTLSMTSAWIALQATRSVAAKEIGVDMHLWAEMNKLLEVMVVDFNEVSAPYKEQAAKETDDELDRMIKEARDAEEKERISAGLKNGGRRVGVGGNFRPTRN